MRKDDEERDAFVERGLACVRQGGRRPPHHRHGPVRSPTRRPIPCSRSGSASDRATSWWSGSGSRPSIFRGRPGGRAAARLCAPRSAWRRSSGCATPPSRARSSSCAPAPTWTRGRGREAALQLRVGLEALLAERARLTGHGQEADLASCSRAAQGHRRRRERGAPGASVGRAREPRSRRRLRSASAFSGAALPTAGRRAAREPRGRR